MDKKSGATSNTTPIEFEVLLKESGFSPSQQVLIQRAAQGQEEIEEDRNLLKETEEYDFVEGQKPNKAIVCCSDSRTTQAQIAAELVGKTLVYRIPGGFLTVGGEFIEAGGAFVELASAYGVKDIVISQHSGCGAMDAIYTYHMEKGSFHGEVNGAAYVKNHKGRFFVKIAEAQKVLVDKVKENGLQHYEDMGIPLVGDEASKFKQAMAIQQVLWDYKAIKEKQAAEPHLKISEPLALFQHVLMSRTFVFLPNENKFAIVPRLDNKLEVTNRKEPAPPVFKPKCGCGCEQSTKG
jgi:carbonic anhydrase